MGIREDASAIIGKAIRKVLPGPAVKRALRELPPCDGRTVVIAVGKAAYRSAAAARDVLKDGIFRGLIVTKDGHAESGLPPLEILEAGHPVPDERCVRAAERAVSMVSGLNGRDRVIFLISGGASALFEKPAVPMDELIRITDDLLRSGADIREINTVRKHLSLVKGGRFARLSEPASVYGLVLSDVLGNDVSSVGSGPVSPDSTTGEEALSIVEKYGIRLSDDAVAAILQETPKVLRNAECRVIGDLSGMVDAAADAAAELGYEPMILTKCLDTEASAAGAFFGAIAKTYAGAEKSLALIAGGETVVHVKGNGKGGRNQEMALAAAPYLDGLRDVCFFSVGSDGTDGPTDAAGGIVTGETAAVLKNAGIDVVKALLENDSYEALKAVRSLIVTGPTGTNVNDLSVLLIKRV